MPDVMEVTASVDVIEPKRKVKPIPKVSRQVKKELRDRISNINNMIFFQSGSHKWSVIRRELELLDNGIKNL